MKWRRRQPALPRHPSWMLRLLPSGPDRVHTLSPSGRPTVAAINLHVNLSTRCLIVAPGPRPTSHRFDRMHYIFRKIQNFPSADSPSKYGSSFIVSIDITRSFSNTASAWPNPADVQRWLWIVQAKGAPFANTRNISRKADGPT